LACRTAGAAHPDRYFIGQAIDVVPLLADWCERPSAYRKTPVPPSTMIVWPVM
jgi:hypothetical protein